MCAYYTRAKRHWRLEEVEVTFERDLEDKWESTQGVHAELS